MHSKKHSKSDLSDIMSDKNINQNNIPNTNENGTTFVQDTIVGEGAKIIIQSEKNTTTHANNMDLKKDAQIQIFNGFSLEGETAKNETMARMLGKQREKWNKK